jgi:hypothetical protein
MTPRRAAWATASKAAEISIERATALISMAHSWDKLAEDMARYEAIVKAEAQK